MRRNRRFRLPYGCGDASPIGLFCVVVFIAASALLLIADRMHRTSAIGDLPQIAIFQFASRPVLDESAAEMLRQRYI